MIWKIGMPNLGHTMEEGSISQWLVEPGTDLSKGDVIALVESDKVSVEIETPADGRLLKILSEAGEGVPPGHVVALVGDPEDAAEAEAYGEAKAPAADSGDAPADPVPTGSETTERSTGRSRRIATPLAKRHAKRLSLDVREIAGSGPKGVVVKNDVLKAAEKMEPRGEAATQPERPQVHREGGARPLQGTRAAIARKMSRAWSEIPMVTLVATADVSALAAKEDGVGLNATIMSAAARCLRRHPDLNAWLHDGRIDRRETIDMGFAVALEDGLVTPVIRRADQREPDNLASEVKRLAEAARSGELAPADMFDATFTVSNLGGYGVELFTPIINPPQVAILGIGCLRREPEPTGTGIVFRECLSLSLVFDHRALDGAAGARFLQDLRTTLAKPENLAVTASEETK